MADTPFPPLKREPLLEEERPSANPNVRLIIGARIKFALGQPTGLHRHPISTLGVVTAGSFILQLEGEAARLLKAGDGFFEPAGHTILKFDNASTTESPKSSASILRTRRSARRSRCSLAAWTASWETVAAAFEGPKATPTRLFLNADLGGEQTRVGAARFGDGALRAWVFVAAPWRGDAQPHKLTAHFARAERRNTFGARGGGPAQ